MLLSLDYLTALFYYIPKAALAAVIITAVGPLFDTKIVRTLWRVKSMYFLTCRHEVIDGSPLPSPSHTGAGARRSVALGGGRVGPWLGLPRRGTPSPSPPGTCQGGTEDVGMARRDHGNSPAESQGFPGPAVA